MKNLSKVLALVLVVAMVFSLAVSAGAAASFKDDASVEYKEAVQLLAALDVLNGYDTDGDGKGDTFKPGKSITRAELTVMLSYLVANEDAKYGLYNDIAKLNKDYKSLCTFADSKDHYAAGFIAFCYGNGYISGRAADKFDPAGNVTVAEATVMLLRVMGYDAEIEEFGTTANTVKGYNLQLTARNAGLLDGLDNVNFFAPATREQVAQLFMNALDAYSVSYTVTGARINNAYVYEVNQNKFSDYEKLVNVCFQHVLKVNTTNAYGMAGHQWVTYANFTVQTNNFTKVNTAVYTGAVGTLTDVVVDDNAVASYVGGTSYAKISSDLGLTSATSLVPVEVYVNGAKLNKGVFEVDGPNNDRNFVGTLPGAGTDYAGTLNAIYSAGVYGDALPDNVALTIVRDYDRSVGGTYYKLMYYYEFVAEVTDISYVNHPVSSRYGQYQYTFTYYWGTNSATDVVYASKDAYAEDVYYIVVPNESSVPSGSTYPNFAEYNAFLSVEVAKTFAPFTAITGAKKTFVSPANYYISDGTTTHYVSANITDFTGIKGGADYGDTIGLVFNTAGYVAGYSAVKAAPGESGYVYVDSLMIRETGYFGENPFYTATSSWLPEAMAQVYFPTLDGNDDASVINLRIDLLTKTVAVDSANYDEIIKLDADADGYVKDGYIKLSGKHSNAFLDTANENKGAEYVWNAGLSNVRLYNAWFDGWYVYTKYSDGTYSLAPVGTDQAEITKTDANLGDDTTDKYESYKLTSSTEVYTYTMDLGTMTAKASVQTAYKGITSGIYGGTSYKGNGTTGHKYTMPYIGTVGGIITANDNTKLVSRVDEFKTNRAESKYDFTLFRGESGYVASLGQSGLKFLVAGGAEVLYLADTVYWTGVGQTTKEFKDNHAPILASLKASYADTDADGAPDHNEYAYRLTITNGKITAIEELETEHYEVTWADSDGWVTLKDNKGTTDKADDVVVNGGAAMNYNTANVWNYSNGTVDSIAKGDTIYYVQVAGGAEIDAVWCITPGAWNLGTPNWNVPNYSDNMIPWFPIG